jgi:hypothetical protein
MIARQNPKPAGVDGERLGPVVSPPSQVEGKFSEAFQRPGSASGRITVGLHGTPLRLLQRIIRQPPCHGHLVDRRWRSGSRN